MAKRKGIGSSQVDGPKKKHKKHKKHKKRRGHCSSGSGEIDVVSYDSNHDETGGLKLKIKFDGETLSSSEVYPEEEIQAIEEIGTVEGEDNLVEEEFPVYEAECGLPRSCTDDDDEDNDSEVHRVQCKHGELDIDSMFTEEEQDNGRGMENAELDEDSGSEPNADDSSSLPPSRQPRKNDDDDDDEKWLQALEAGELDDAGRLKRERSVALMTARQRALHGQAIDGETELFQLPMYSAKNEEQSEEAERKRKIRARKRKQQMEKQIEESKSQTIEKLLNKGHQRDRKEISKSQRVADGPHIRYTVNVDGMFLSCSGGTTFPFLQSHPAILPPQPVICSAAGCGKTKKYACSGSKLPVCSLQCYKIMEAT